MPTVAKKVLLTFTNITTAIILVLILGPILRGGMFLDGLIYSSIARNLSTGMGSFWKPVYGKYDGIFYEHPVLLPWIESNFFLVFGDTLYTEDIYNVAVFSLTLIVIWRLWKHLVTTEYQSIAFLPILFFVLGQEVQLRYPNNMLECGLTLILLTTTFTYLKLQKHGHLLFSYAVVGIGVLLAFLAKGPPGLFLLALPWVHQLITIRKFNWSALLLPSLFYGLAFGLLLLLNSDAYAFIQQYFDQQVLAAIRGERLENIASHRWRFIELLIMANLPAILIGSLIYFGGKQESSLKSSASLFVILGLLAILPLAISIKQAAYYQIPSIPFFCLGFAMLIAKNLLALLQKASAFPKLVSFIFVFSWIGVAAGIVFALSSINTFDKRDAVLINDVNMVRQTIHELDPNLDHYKLKIIGDQPWIGESKRYRLIAYLNRHHRLFNRSDGEVNVTVFLKSGDGIGLSSQKVHFENERVIVTKE